MQIVSWVRRFGTIGLLSSLGFAMSPPTAVLAQQSVVMKIIAIEGAVSRQPVLSREGTVIEAETVSQSPADIIPDKAPLGSGQVSSTVSGVVASITPQKKPPQTAWLKIVTSAGQILTLEVSTSYAAGVQVGETITIQLP